MIYNTNKKKVFVRGNLINSFWLVNLFMVLCMARQHLALIIDCALQLTPIREAVSF